MMTIRSEQCTTCIYRPDSPLRDNLPVLEDEIRDPRAPYHFVKARACHFGVVAERKHDLRRLH